SATQTNGTMPFRCSVGKLAIVESDSIKPRNAIQDENPGLKYACITNERGVTMNHRALIVGASGIVGRALRPTRSSIFSSG
ncbi:hypothetical protein, partial [Burkholderia multivorans]|uniref:hypothetical protein n=1 Tax=Burkholderia multivorans TaxID=87883 RepID=UPI003510C849